MGENLAKRMRITRQFVVLSVYKVRFISPRVLIIYVFKESLAKQIFHLLKNLIWRISINVLLNINT